MQLFKLHFEETIWSVNTLMPDSTELASKTLGTFFTCSCSDSTSLLRKQLLFWLIHSSETNHPATVNTHVFLQFILLLEHLDHRQPFDLIIGHIFSLNCLSKIIFSKETSHEVMMNSWSLILINVEPSFVSTDFSPELSFWCFIQCRPCWRVTASPAWRGSSQWDTGTVHPAWILMQVVPPPTP